MPTGSVTVTNHKGLLVVYKEELSAIALLGDQEPSSEIDPASLMFWPYTVVAITLNVTATAVGVVHGAVVEVVFADVVVVVPLPDLLVNVVGQAVFVALLKVPTSEVYWHWPGILLADVSPHGAGTIAFRRSLAVSRAA